MRTALRTTRDHGDAHLDGCFWERQDAAGETIDNFILAGSCAEVAIQSGDYRLRDRGRLLRRPAARLTSPVARQVVEGRAGVQSQGPRLRGAPCASDS
jgi:hypothetical protein